MINWVLEKDKLQELINSGVSYESIGRMYGCTGANIKKQAKKQGIILPKRRSINEKESFGRRRKCRGFCENCGRPLESKNSKKYCSVKCQTEKQYKDYVERWKNGEEDGLNGKYGISGHIRRYLFEKYNCACQICGWNEVNPISGKVPLQIHHIDGDCLNNKEENLQLLCPNHHSLTETFGNLNKVSKRVFRKQKENN